MPLYDDRPSRAPAHRPTRQAAGAPAQAAKAAPRSAPDLELQAASAVSLLYRRAMGWPYRGQLTSEKFSPPILAWLQRLTGDEARTVVTSGKNALLAHLSGKRPIDGLSPLYGRGPSATGARQTASRRRPAPADDDADESLEVDAAYGFAARI